MPGSYVYSESLSPSFAFTFSPFALLMARSGRRTLSTLKIFTTEMVLDLESAGKEEKRGVIQLVAQAEKSAGPLPVFRASSCTSYHTTGGMMHFRGRITCWVLLQGDQEQSDRESKIAGQSQLGVH